MEVHHVVDLLRRPGIPSPAGLNLAIEDGILSAAALGAVALLDGDHLRTLLGGGPHGGHTCHAAANDQYLCGDFFLHHIVGDLGGLAQPLAVIGR